MKVNGAPSLSLPTMHASYRSRNGYVLVRNLDVQQDHTPISYMLRKLHGRDVHFIAGQGQRLADLERLRTAIALPSWLACTFRA